MSDKDFINILLNDISALKRLIADIEEERQILAEIDKDEAACNLLAELDPEGNASAIETILKKYESTESK